MREGDAGWLAGIIDGEGCITRAITRREGRRLPYVSMGIVVKLSEPSGLERIASLYDQLDVNFAIYQGVDRPQHKSTQSIQVHRYKDTLRLAKFLLPRCTIKKSDLEVAIEVLSLLVPTQEYARGDVRRRKAQDRAAKILSIKIPPRCAPRLRML